MIMVCLKSKNSPVDNQLFNVHVNVYRFLSAVNRIYSIILIYKALNHICLKQQQQ